MKRFNEMSKTELLELSTVEVQNLIDLECAFGGIPLTPPIPVLKTGSIPDKDLTVYSIGNFSTLDIEQAYKIQALVKDLDLVTTDYDYNAGGYQNKFVKPLDNNDRAFTIETMKAYSFEVYQTIKSTLQVNLKVKEEYDALMKVYNDSVDNISEIRLNITGEIAKANKYFNDVETYKSMYTHYIELADGNKEIAMNFLQTAYPDVINFPEVMSMELEVK